MYTLLFYYLFYIGNLLGIKHNNEQKMYCVWPNIIRYVIFIIL